MKPLRAIVTGGATNIGLAISEAFLARGGRVVVSQRQRGLPPEVAKRYGDRLIVLPVDVGQPALCKEFIAEAAKRLGGIDVLVNNAAITGGGAVRNLAGIDEAHVDSILNVNIKGVIFCSQAAAPHLRAAGGGVIVNISSINAFRPQRGATVYAASKAAMTSLTQSMAKELAPDRIRVVAVAPGDIRIDSSGEVEQALKAQGAGSDVINQTPLGQGVPPDIGEVVAFLCSDAAKFVTGTTWLVDGGLLA
jgi:NAD(P)-dependent dehydrogenase (short-subunit alcohol dehydrogenase family)